VKVSFPVKLFFLAVIMMPELALGAGSGNMAISATVLSKNQCKFNTAAATLNFGNLDPSNPVDVTASATFVFKCVGSDDPATFAMIDDDGLYETGPNANRMRHATDGAAYLPYGISLNPTSGSIPRNVNQNLTVTGTITGANYQTAIAGSYSDTVVISIAP